MAIYRFYHPIEVRYGDLDPQGHLNNAKYMTFMEQARIQYVKHLGLWGGESFLDIGIILAEARITFLAPIQFGDSVMAGARVSHLGNKSLEMEYTLEDAHNSREFASGSSILVAFNYRARQSIPLPEAWRTAISTFENIPAFSN